MDRRNTDPWLLRTREEISQELDQGSRAATFADSFLPSTYSPGQFMNPGPAPRPPIDRQQTDRARTPIGVNNGSSSFTSRNYSTTSLTSPSLQNSRTWSSAGSSTTSGLSRANTLDPLQAAGAVKQGWIKYKEEGLGGLIWKTKWVVLRQNTIEFLKAEGGKLSFTIILAHVTGVQRWDAIPMCIELVRAANPAAHPGVPLREQPQKAMYMKFDGDEDLYEWQDGIYTRCPAISGVSNPTNFSHRIHVGFDPTTGGFLGLPAEWEKLLTTSAITKDDYLKNPEAVIEVLEFYTDINKRAENPDTFPHLMPTPPAHTSQNMQLGHGGAGTSIAPPRPAPPSDRSMSFSGQQHPQQRAVTQPGRPSGPSTPLSNQRNFSGPAGYGPPQAQNGYQPNAMDSKLGMGPEMRRIMDEEAKKIKDQQEEQQRERQRHREEEERERREQEEYNATIPQKKQPMAKQELGGYGGPSAPDPSRFNPTRAAPAAPGSDRARQQQQQGSGPRTATPNRADPSNMDRSNASPAPPRAPYAQSSHTRDQSPSSTSSLRTPASRKDPQVRQPSPATRPPVKPSNERNQSPASRAPGTSGANGAAPPTRLPGPVQQVKPLNVAKANGQVPHPAPKLDPAAVAAANKEHVPATKVGDGAAAGGGSRPKEARMSSMSESEVMAKLKKIVTKLEPGDSYVKQKKIGQGASGSVYIAKVRPDASSPVGRTLWKKDGSDARVAIKTMDLKHQPRKELIVNEIIVMKESVHPNIVNYLDSFLIENDTELWVIMEYMNGGALTDVIENNPAISEDQIAAICNEVHRLMVTNASGKLTLGRHVRVSRIYTAKILFIGTSRATTFCLTHTGVSRSVSLLTLQSRCLCANRLQPISDSAPSSPSTSPSAPPWWARPTGWRRR